MNLSTKPTDTELKLSRRLGREPRRLETTFVQLGENPQLGFKEISLVDFMPDYAKLSKAAIDKRGYTDISSQDIIEYCTSVLM